VIGLRIAENENGIARTLLGSFAARRRRLDLAAMGLVFGVGFWCSPEVA
jgi:hypothetical protein